MSKYLYLKVNPYKKNGTKLVYWVVSKKGKGILGEIAWYYKWRQYCFYPAPNTLFNKSCMIDIIDSINDQNVDKQLEKLAKQFKDK